MIMWTSKMEPLHFFKLKPGTYIIWMASSESFDVTMSSPKNCNRLAYCHPYSWFIIYWCILNCLNFTTVWGSSALEPVQKWINGLLVKTNCKWQDTSKLLFSYRKISQLSTELERLRKKFIIKLPSSKSQQDGKLPRNCHFPI